MLKKLLVSVLLIASLASCSKNSATTDKADSRSPEEVIALAQENVKDIKSIGYTMNMDISINISGQKFENNTFIEGEMIVDPLQMKFNVDLSAGLVGNASLTAYLVQEEGKAYLYMGAVEDGKVSEWVKQEVTNQDLINQYNGAKSVNSYIEKVSNIVEVGQEEIDGVQTIRYDGEIAGEQLKNYLIESKSLDSLTSLGYDPDETTFDENTKVSFKIWIDPVNYFPVKYEIDMNDFMKTIGEKINETAASDKITFEKSVVSMTMHDYNKIESIELPEEALNATLIPSN